VKHLDLFSGIGGFALGLQKVGFETVAFCDIEKYCQHLLKQKWNGIKIYSDVREITKEKFKADGIESPEIITGGFPCQPFSVAGSRKGTDDNRHLWPEMFRIIKEFKPRWIIGENVRGIVSIQDGLVFETVCTDLESEGYEVQTFNIPAVGVGAPHKRERIWIVANSRCSVRREQSSRNSESIRSRTFKETERSTDTSEITRPSERTETMADTESKRTGENNERLRSGTSGISGREGTTRIQEDVANSNTGNVEAGCERQRRIREENTKERQSNNVTGSSEVMANTNESISRERQIFGNPNDKGRGASETRRESLQPEDRQTRTDNLGSGSEVMANTNSERQQEQCRPKSIQEEGNELECSSSQSGGNFWDIEPDVGRVVNGLPGRVHRLKGLGNAIVPQIAEEIGRAIMKAEQQ
jgi:DNA (cytosine-5)-methyltransferase 1